MLNLNYPIFTKERGFIMPEGLDNLLNATGKAFEIVPEAYNDVVQPAAKESGKTLSLIPRTINAALIPLQCWISRKEYQLAETEKLLALKLEKVSAEKIITPDPYVAVPAIQAISYSMDSEELRNLYANLLSKSMNIDTKSLVHPSFVEIIKQMSPIDAQVFKDIMGKTVLPIVDIKVIYPNNGGHKIIRRNITWITHLAYELVSVSLDNLCRLGLINIPNGNSYAVKSHYDIVINSHFTKTFIEQLKLKHPDKTFDFNHSLIEITDLGINFNKICVNDN